MASQMSKTDKKLPMVRKIVIFVMNQKRDIND